MRSMVRLENVDFCECTVTVRLTAVFTKTDWEQKSIPELYALAEKMILEYFRDAHTIKEVNK